MIKLLSRKFMDRIAFRKAAYYKNKKEQTIRNNAMKMAHNWKHEYPTGTPLEYIRDDIIECWKRTDKKRYTGLDSSNNTMLEPKESYDIKAKLAENV